MLQQSLQAKLSLALASVVLASALIVGTVISYQKASAIHEHAEELAKSRLGELVHLLETTDVLMSERVTGAMNLLKDRARAMGEPSLAEPVDLLGETVPDLRFGYTSQVQIFTLVDEVTRIAGGTATLFVKKGSDFVRVTTNVMSDGKRAVGTRLDPLGKAIVALRNGQPFYGQVDILGNPFLTAYEPMRDANGDIIGAWYVGYKADMKTLEATLESSRIRQAGVVLLADDRGRVRGHTQGADKAHIEQLAKGEVDGWVTHRAAFAPWGYTAIAAYPLAEVEAAVMDQILGVVVVTLLVSVVVLLMIYWQMQRLVIRPLANAVACAERIAEGRLDQTIRTDSQDEVGRLIQALGKMQQSLRQFMQEMARASDHVAQAATDLSSVTAETQRRVEDQRSRTDQVATAMTEMSATVSDVASNALAAAEATQSAEQEADRVQQNVSATVNAIQSLASEINQAAEVMRMLAEDSDRIGSVLDVIRNIAGQTNLLALNAAIEAARAGEQGRGFAVVADEVRTLASRTQTSTEEIQSMIQRLQSGTQNAVARVESGHVMARSSVEQVNAMSRSLDAITEAVSRINLMNTQVASAAEEQSVVAEDVNRNILHITEVAEVTSENAERTSMSAQQLGGLASDLRQLIHRYRV